jgi:hypothetical protein
MALTDITNAEREFTAQRHEFLDAAKARYPSTPSSMEELISQRPIPSPALTVQDLCKLTAEEINKITQSLTQGKGVVHVVPLTFKPAADGEQHPQREFARLISSRIEIGYPVDHPMELHPEARARFGSPDGTLKLYNLPIPEGHERYREQAETNQLFAAHNDGLGYAGLIYTSIITLDRPPAWGGVYILPKLRSIGGGASS